MALPARPALTLNRHRVLHLAPDQSLVPLSIDDATWSHPETVSELQEGRIMSVFDYESSWTWWERHPVGAELVLAVSGEVVFHLQGDDSTDASAVVVRPGECLVIPEGAWHRAEITAPATLLFVTPSPARTQHRDLAPEGPG